MALSLNQNNDRQPVKLLGFHIDIKHNCKFHIDNTTKHHPDSRNLNCISILEAAKSLVSQDYQLTEGE